MKNNDYIAIFEKYLDDMQKIGERSLDLLKTSISDLCEYLRIGRIDVSVIEHSIRSALSNRTDFVLYDSDPVDESVCVVMRYTTVSEEIVSYSAFLRIGDPEWSEEESLRVKRFIETTHLFLERARLNKKIEKLVYYDHDFNIYNIKYYINYVTQLVAQGRIGSYAAIFANLRRFSVVNQQIGRANGTRVMQGFIDRLVEEFRPGDVIARAGGDNFTLIVCKENLDAILSILAGTPIRVDGAEGERIMVSATAGVYVVPEDEKRVTTSDIMDRISLSSHIARATGSLDPVFFNDEIMKRSERANAISALFPSAVKREEFMVYYQPKVSVETLTLSGAEALCRWKHNGRTISPGDFIPVLEQGMDICRLDFYMLDRVCRDIRGWIDAGSRPVKVSVNFSRRHLSDIDLAGKIIAIIDKSAVPHELVEIELTETTTDVEFSNLTRVIAELQTAGLSVSVDDFGIGYSSMNLIKDISWNVLKLDKSLLPTGNEGFDRRNEILFRHIVAMSKDMGLECIAEGVETKEQLRLLHECSCGYAQGFYFDRPLPKSEFETRLGDYVYEIV